VRTPQWVWACALACPFSHAQSPPTDATIGDIAVRAGGVVVITGEAPSSLPTRIPTTIEGAAAAQIERTVNATDSEDAIKYFPSLLVRKRYIGDYNHAVLSTRASGTGNSARSMVFADGILLSNLLGNGATFTPRWGLLTPEEIQRVDVLYGPFSAAYAGNSVGAVVDYVTRMPKAFEAHARMGGFVQPFQLYQTDDTYTGWQASASVGSRAGDWSWWVNVNRLDSQGQPLVFATRIASTGVAPVATDVPVSGAVLAQNRAGQDWYILGTTTQFHTVQDHAKFKLAYDLQPTVRATLTLGSWHNQGVADAQSHLHDAAGNTVTSGRPVIDGRAFAALAASDFAMVRDGLDHLMGALSIKSRTRGVFDWEVAASGYDYRRDLSRTHTTALPAARDGGAGRITDLQGTGWQTLALRGVWRPQGEQGEHVVDLGVQQDTFRLRQRIDNADDWIAGAPTTPVSGFEGNTRLQSVYAQDTWRFAPRWTAVLGARAEAWTAWGGVTRTGASRFEHAERSEHYVSPKAALGFEINEQWVLKASTGKAVRTPTVSELYQGGFNAAGTGFINNDPDLKPEQGWTTEVSSEWDWGPQRLRATLFHEATRDGLFSQTNVTVTPNVTNVQNVDRLRTTGIELAGQAQDVALRGLGLQASLTYADSRTVKNDRFPASVGKWQPRVPRWRATAVATWQASERWSTSLAARYSGMQYSTLDNSDPNGFAYQGASKYFTVDARLLYRFDRQWSAAFGIDNLNNYQYWNFHPYPQRTYSAELKFDL
jgi:iron complex outermembrane recepter protein